MINNIKILLGDAAANYTEEQINLFFDMSVGEIKAYCNRSLDAELEMIAQRITAIKLIRMGAEGVTSQSFSGVSESYLDGYPADIQAVLNRKRKIKVV